MYPSSRFSPTWEKTCLCKEKTRMELGLGLLVLVWPLLVLLGLLAGGLWLGKRVLRCMVRIIREEWGRG